jgi:glycosyltransferase involved in cell wall biosynthesis
VARGIVAAALAARCSDIVHVHGEVAAVLCLPLLALRPSAVTLHGLHLVRRLSGLRRRQAVLNLRLILRVAGRTICVSQSEHDTLSRAVGAGAASRAVVIANGVKVDRPPGAEERGAVRAELGLHDSDAVALWVGSLNERKDPLTAARAAREAGVTLLVVGEGSLRARLEAEPGGRLRLLGARSDVSRLLSAADVFVVTSSREGLSFALLEALAAGVPAVVTELPENVEAVGEAGVAVPFGDVRGFADALARIVPERARLAEAARTRAAELFPAEQMIGRTRELYNEVLGERQPCTRPLPTAQ